MTVFNNNLFQAVRFWRLVLRILMHLFKCEKLKEDREVSLEQYALEQTESKRRYQ